MWKHLDRQRLKSRQFDRNALCGAEQFLCDLKHMCNPQSTDWKNDTLIIEISQCDIVHLSLFT